MTETPERGPDDTDDTADATEEQLSGPGAGLSRTGRTADDFTPGDPSSDVYGDPGVEGRTDVEGASE